MSVQPQKFKIVQYGNIKVYYLPNLNGGGTEFGQDFIPEVKEKFGKVNNLCEFASGPGFIGFSLLAQGLCKKLCLIDINKEAINLCIKTIKSNRLETKVKTYVSDVLRNVPKKEKWDLVVSNPPFFNGTLKQYKSDLLGIDPGWRIHKEFYKNISKHLSKNGSVLFYESLDGSTPKMWENLITKNGLLFIKSFPHKKSLYKTFTGALKTLSALRFAEIKKHYSIFRKQKISKAPSNLLRKFRLGYFVLSKSRNYKDL